MIIVDLDGTIADCSHRLHLIQGEKKDWNAFYKACKDDKPIERVLSIVNTLEEYHDLVFITGRSEICREETYEWLDKNSYMTCSELLMRKEGDFRPDTEVKKELLDEYLNKNNMNCDYDSVEMVFEDRSSVVKMWRELGLTVCQVAEGDF